MEKMRELYGPGLPQPVRTYKDRLFRMIFKDKAEFLTLYNALNGTSYDNPEALKITTLEHAVYIGMKNDLSFLLDMHLPLYEHQSSHNPNMPLRDLLYVASIYSRLTQDANLYGTRLIKLPTPQFAVFYNGTAPMPERSVVRLSDAFEHPTGDPALELKVLVLNINPGYNEELMQSCQTLREYSEYVAKVREYHKTLPLNHAVQRAVDTCIENGVLKKFLKEHKAEVIAVSIFEYNEELHIQMERKDAREEGYAEGKEDGILTMVRAILKANEPLEKILRYSGLSPEEIERLKSE